MNIYKVPDLPAVLMTNPGWDLLLLVLVADADLLQAYETLRYLGTDCQKEFIELSAELDELKRKHVGNPRKIPDLCCGGGVIGTVDH